MAFIDAIIRNPQLVLVPAGVFAAVLLVGLAARGSIYRILLRLTRKTDSPIDDHLVRSTRTASLLWCLMIALYVAVGISRASPQVINYSSRLLGGLLALSVSLALANVAVHAFRYYAGKADLPATGLTEVVIRVAVIGLGVTLGLGFLGIDITPLVAAFGVGGLAVALGLQDTLANVFAGIHILMSKPVRVGDYVKLDSGEEGYVADVNWRATTIRTLANAMVVVPNNRLVQTILTNYHLPEPELSVVVPVAVHYRSDLEHVERVTIEVAKEVTETVEGAKRGFEPVVRYHTFGESSINFSLILRVDEFGKKFLVQHELVKRLHARYRREGIVIPFPIRTLDIPPEILAQIGSSNRSARP